MQTKMPLYQGHLFLVWLKNANYSKRGEVKSTTAAKLLWWGGRVRGLFRFCLQILTKFACILRRIYTTFVLGTALQNSGTRANRFGHGPLDFHGKICSSFFNVDFWNGTPETGTALLNFRDPALI